jgi:hypothetical protein
MVEQTVEKTRWTQAELVEEARARFGDDALKWSFRCPRCGDDATAQDFKDAGADPNRVGQECIGRSLGALSGPPTKDGRNRDGRGCDWTAYGLFRGPWIIVVPADSDMPEREIGGFPLSPAGTS